MGPAASRQVAAPIVASATDNRIWPAIAVSPAVFQWLVMRQGVDTVKPDVHVHRFAEVAVGRRLSDADTVAVVVGAAHRLGMKAYQLDWAIWEHSRGGPAGV